MKDFRYGVDIKEDPEVIFSAMTNATTLELWTGYPAVIEPVDGFEFTLWDGDISGRNLEVMPPVKLVQEWYFEGSGQASIVSIELTRQKNRCRVSLVHTNIPDEAYENIVTGWKEYYLGALKKFLES